MWRGAWSLAGLGLWIVGCSGNSSGNDAGTTDAGTTQEAASDAHTEASGEGGGLGHNIGESCPSGPSDCLPGLQCAGEDPGGGQCIKLCTASMDSTCGDTTMFACSFEGHCYLKCNTDADCKRTAEGYGCVNDMPARGVKFCDAKN
jgi:hypothetical protein